MYDKLRKNIAFTETYATQQILKFVIDCFEFDDANENSVNHSRKNWTSHLRICRGNIFDNALINFNIYNYLFIYLF